MRDGTRAVRGSLRRSRIRHGVHRLEPDPGRGRPGRAACLHLAVAQGHRPVVTDRRRHDAVGGGSRGGRPPRPATGRREPPV